MADIIEEALKAIGDAGRDAGYAKGVSDALKLLHQHGLGLHPVNTEIGKLLDGISERLLKKAAELSRKAAAS